MHRSAIVLLSALLLLGVRPLTALAAGVSCHDVDLPVTVSPLVPATLHGRYCAPAGARAVQVLVHGATYDEHYWDQAYDYPADQNAAGYATVAIDKLGYGRSTHLPSELLTATFRRARSTGSSGRFGQGH